jgi:hypothetical protein
MFPTDHEDADKIEANVIISNKERLFIGSGMKMRGDQSFYPVARLLS